MRLFEERGFAAAGATVFLVGAALFGSLLLLPLYFQIGRGLSPLDAGLLMAPQGLGAALGMNRAGRLTDRVGGGPVVIAGLLGLMLGTVAFTQVRPDTPYWVLEVSLFVRGIGLGFAMMPAMAAAYSTLERWQVPRATPMLNVVQRVGGSLGTAVLAVVLERQLAEAGSRDPGRRGQRLRAHLLVGDGLHRDRDGPGARAGARPALQAGEARRRRCRPSAS